MVKVGAVIPAAGQGTRMGAATPKQYLELNGRPILSYALKTLADCPSVECLVLVCSPGDEEHCRTNIIERLGIKKSVKIVPGGNERQKSVYNGLLALSDDTDIAVIHDGARPLLKPEDLLRVIEAARQYGAATLAAPAKDTVKVADERGMVVSTLKRESLWLIQTPQAFNYDLIMRAHQQATQTGFKGNDDASLVEVLGEPVSIVTGSYANIKITTQEDLLIATAYLRSEVVGATLGSPVPY